MGDTKIEWTDKTWNPTTGCDRVSPGCDNCYAERIATRFGRPFLGAVEVHEDRLGEPFRWRTPKRVFVNSVSDLFHGEIDEHFLAEVFAVMSLTPQHTYQVLTKRHKNMLGVMTHDDWWYKVSLSRQRLMTRRNIAPVPLKRPLPNVWLGVSVENQRYADLRIPSLLETPAAVRFISAEPLLGPIDMHPEWFIDRSDAGEHAHGALGWVIVGGESGPGARPMHPTWARGLRDQCQASGVAYFLKQWGEWGEALSIRPGLSATSGRWLFGDGTWVEAHARDTGEIAARFDGALMQRVGKGRAGRELDGRTWDEYPS